MMSERQDEGAVYRQKGAVYRQKGAVYRQKGVSEGELASTLVSEIHAAAMRIGRPVRLMEVCGTHTVELRKQGIHSLLPESVRLVSGPGCPVCVTPISYIDNAIALAESGEALIVSFGDMLRVPSSNGKTLGSLGPDASAKLLYSPHDLAAIARKSGKPVVFLGVGFETTIPTILSALRRAREEGLRSLFLYSAFKTIVPALKLLLADPSCALDGFLLPGHVSVIIGAHAYSFLEQPGGIPGAITGFEPIDMLLGILALLRQIEKGECRVLNAYPRAVRNEGNPRALSLMREMLEPRDEEWRGLGSVPGGALHLRPSLRDMDAESRFELAARPSPEPPGCLCAKVIAGAALPAECALFGSACTPDDPVGPCMVSSEGTCAASFRYGGRQG